jgi:acetate kinase
VKRVLTINGGSSSLRYALFEVQQRPVRLLDGKLERLSNDSAQAVRFMMEKLEAQAAYAMPDAIGHRIVHGMQHSAPERITPALLAELRKIVPYDPEHLPREIEFIRAMQRRFKKIPQVACFDTAFHRSMPRVATLLPIPRRYAALGVQRYGFHGLSFTFLLQELRRLGDDAASGGRVILAHLGSGASLAAVRNGRCIDTSMGFTPTAGLVMGTRSGDLDPGLMSYLSLNEHMNAKAFQTMVNHESGMLGLSETSADVRDLLEHESSDQRAREALDLFCYQAKKWIGSFAAVLGGLDTLVFAGGVGENAAIVRQRISEGLEFLGLRLDLTANMAAAAVISSQQSQVSVRIIRTDEESVIAEETARLLGMSDIGEAACKPTQ